MSRHFSPYPRFVLLLGLVLILFSLSTGATTFTVTNLNDSGPGSLRQAILDANATVDDDTIVFQSGLSGTISLTSGELTISSNLTINGPGANVLAVSGNKASRIISIGVYTNTASTVVLNGLTLKDGFSDIAGGGIFNSKILTITDSILSGNSAGDSGGGIFNSGTLTLVNNTLSDNSATYVGGGISNAEMLTVSNSTLSGNSAGSIGGGILNYGALTVSNSTLSGNFANIGGGIYNLLSRYNPTILKIGNSLVAGNTALTGKEVSSSGGNASAFTSLGHNLFGENGASGVEGGTLTASDIVPTVSISAILAPLGDYGGPTQTHLLLPGSPAIDAGDNALIPAGVTTDQRGFPRIQNGTVDIGAVEVGSATDIPTLSQWALLLGGGLLIGMALLAQVQRTRPLRG